MSTRGAYGFYKNGITKIVYNTGDSYFDGLGYDIINSICGVSIEEMYETFDAIELIPDAWLEEPTWENLEQRKFCDELINVPLNHYFDGIEDKMINKADFIKDVFCEFAYIINLDTNKLELYMGSLENIKYDDSKKNRYIDFEDSGCKEYGHFPMLINEVDLQKIITSKKYGYSIMDDAQAYYMTMENELEQMYENEDDE